MRRITVHSILEKEVMDAFKEFTVDMEIVSRKSSPIAKVFYVISGDSIRKIRSVSQDVAYRIGVDKILIEPDPKRKAIKIIIPAALSTPLAKTYRDKYAPMGLKIPVGLGVEGPVYHDFGSTAHLLVAGTTGSGKSYLIHSILQGILTADIPYLSIVPMDFKRTELLRYEKFLPEIFSAVKDVAGARDVLVKLIDIMNMRYEMLGHTYKNIDEYNKATGSKLDRIFVVIDEFAEMMLTDKSIAKEIEVAIIRLAQKSRAAGIHLIISTQRPSADVVSGQIKANIEGRLALRVTTPTESRIILSMAGAENLNTGAFIYKVGHPTLGRVFATNLGEIDTLIETKAPLKRIVAPTANPYVEVVSREVIEFEEQFASRPLGGVSTLSAVDVFLDTVQEISAQQLLEILASENGLSINDIHFNVQCALEILERRGKIKNFRGVGSASVNVNSRTFREWSIYNLKYVVPDETRLMYKSGEETSVLPNAELTEDTKAKVADLLRYMTLDKRIRIVKRLLHAFKK